MHTHAGCCNRTIQENFVGDHENLLFRALATFNWKLTDGLTACHTVLFGSTTTNTFQSTSPSDTNLCSNREPIPKAKGG